MGYLFNTGRPNAIGVSGTCGTSPAGSSPNRAEKLPPLYTSNDAIDLENVPIRTNSALDVLLWLIRADPGLQKDRLQRAVVVGARGSRTPDSRKRLRLLAAAPVGQLDLSGRVPLRSLCALLSSAPNLTRRYLASDKVNAWKPSVSGPRVTSTISYVPLNVKYRIRRFQ